MAATLQSKEKTMQSRLRRRGTHAAAGLIAAAALALIGSGASGAAGKYTDPAGDARGGPDITNVAVASESNGQIVFTISVAGLQVGAEMATLLFIDADANPATGAMNMLGAEYVFLIDEHSNSYGFARWTGSDWDENTPSSTVRVTDGQGSRLVSVNASELGGTQSFNFWIRSITGAVAAGQFDDAPDDAGFNYTLAAAGPDIRQVGVKATPSSPRVGKRFSVEPTTLVLPTGGNANVASPLPESFRCTARLGTRVLRGKGAGGCTFAIPKGSKGKRLTITLTVTYQGATKSVPLVYRVR
jgi:hypothetical protein